MVGCHQGRVRLIEPASIEISDLRTYDEGWYECSVVMLDERNGNEETSDNGSWVHLTVNGRHFHAAILSRFPRPCRLYDVLIPSAGTVSEKIEEFFSHCT